MHKWLICFKLTCLAITEQTISNSYLGLDLILSFRGNTNWLKNKVYHCCSSHILGNKSSIPPPHLLTIWKCDTDHWTLLQITVACDICRHQGHRGRYGNCSIWCGVPRCRGFWFQLFCGRWITIHILLWTHLEFLLNDYLLKIFKMRKISYWLIHLFWI